MSILKDFYKDYLEALAVGDAALFVGAGLSRASGYVDWKQLLEEIAHDVGLKVEIENDLIAVAQYHVTSRGSRAKLNKKLLEEFTEHAELSENHHLIASLPIRLIWTTNYDTLIEQAYREAHKRADVKISVANLAQTYPRRDVTIVKMHGDISQPQDAVITKDDYERYAITRRPFADLLQGDLISKTFLFLGFSFTDPNIDYVLGRIRALMGENQREHYCIMCRPRKPEECEGEAKAQYEYELRKYNLRVGDLKRYSIQTIEIDDYHEITEIFRELNRRGHTKDVFVSGSAHDYSPLDRNRIDELARSIGQELIRRGLNLISGFGLGIGSSVIMGAMEALYETDGPSDEGRTILRPFPQTVPNGMTREAFNTRYRESMLSQAGIVVVLCGNKFDKATNQTVMGSGVLEECAIAVKHDKIVIPIGATGWAAKQIWDEVQANPRFPYEKPSMKKLLDVLGDENSTNSQLVDAVMTIVQQSTKF